MKTKNILYFILIAAMVLTACNQRNDLADAYGNFEVDAAIISAESTGALLSFQVEEGEKLDKGAMVGLIDTAQVYLQIEQIESHIEATKTKTANIEAQIATQLQQKENLMVQYKRVKNLVESGAATIQQQDELEGQLKLVEKQVSALKTQICSVKHEVMVMEEQKKQLLLKRSKCNIVNPVAGVVLEKYANRGEMAVAGKPLYKVADLSSMFLRCYVSGAQLSEVKVGQKVDVSIDGQNDEMQHLSGRVSWISDEAEFTPKIIQTKEERVKLVYAVKVKVLNDGRLKLGMPGEMHLNGDN
jgi:HlyD family secretion protein